MGKQWKQCQTLFFWAPKSLQMVNAAMKLKDDCSYDQHRQPFKKQRHYFANKGPSSQSYCFSSGHVWMWELDCEEGWVPKNWCSAFFIVQPLHPYMTTGKTIALTRWTFVGKVMSLLLNMLSRLVKAFLPRSKHLLISWLQWPSAVILEPPKIKSVTVSIYLPWRDGTRCHDLHFCMWSCKPTFSLLFHFHQEAL